MHAISVKQDIVDILISSHKKRRKKDRLKLKLAPVPVPVNNPVSEINGVIQSSIYDLGVNALYASLITQQPWLGFPIIRDILKAALAYCAGKLYKILSESATITIINIQTDEELQKYNAASSELAVAISSGGDLSAAQLNFEQALAGIVHFDGIASN